VLLVAAPVPEALRKVETGKDLREGGREGGTEGGREGCEWRVCAIRACAPSIEEGGNGEGPEGGREGERTNMFE